MNTLIQSQLEATCLSSKSIELSVELMAKFSPEQQDIAKIHQAQHESFAFCYQLPSGSISAGFLIVPRKRKGKLPVIIYNRGGTGDFGVVNAGQIILTLATLADMGYVVIGSQYTGNALGTGTDTWGGEDLEAVLYLKTILDSLNFVDLGDITMIGASRGATMMYQVLRQVKYIKRAIAIAGVSDLEDWITYRADMREIFTEMFGSRLKQELNVRSAIRWVDELPSDVVYTLIHGAQDETVRPEQSQKLAEALQRSSYECAPHILPDSDHHLTVTYPDVLRIMKEALTV